MEASLDGIVAVDNHSEVFRNQRMIELLKIPQSVLDEGDDAMRAYVSGSVRNPDDYRQRVEYLLSHPNLSAKDEVELNDGTVLDRYSSPVWSEEGLYYGRIWTFHDITELKHAEEALRESEERCRIAIDNSDDGIALTRDGNAFFANRRFLEIFGYTSIEEVLPLLPLGLFHPDDRERVEEIMSKRRRGEPAPTRYEYKGIRKDGTALDLEARVVSVMYRGEKSSLVYHKDITDRKRAEKALRESENKFRNLAEESVVGVYLIQDGIFKYVNARFAEIHGYKPEEMIGRVSSTDTIVEQDRHEADLNAGRKMSGEMASIRDEFRIRTKQGDIRNVEIYGSTITYEGKRAIIGTLLDVTERRRSEEMLQNLFSELESKNKELEAAYMELRESQKKAIQQEKMASIGQLAAGVAHEINNPMGFIMSNLDSLKKYMTRVPEFIKVQSEAIEALAQENGPSGERVLGNTAERRRSLKIDYLLEDSISLIKESLEGAERVKRIVQDLKNFARVDDREHAPADLGTILDSTLNIIWNEVKHKATVKKEYGDIPQVPCNSGQLSQVFMNILVNAAQAIPSFGEISVKTWQLAGYAYVTISDTGTGIPEDQLNRVFEPFFTTKEIGKGTGLGLSIAYDIVKKHKGDIEVISKNGKGTTFVVAIPFDAS